MNGEVSIFFIAILLTIVFAKIFDKHRPTWRERSSRRKSMWHLPKIVTALILMAGLWYLAFLGMWHIHIIFYPAYENRLANFWQEGIGYKAFISRFLFAIPLFLPAMGVAFIAAKLLVCCIPSARLAFELGAAGDTEMTFYGATSALFRAFIRYLLPIGLGLSLFGAATLSNLA